MSRVLQLQSNQISHQTELPASCAQHFRMWEDITSPYSAKVRAYLHYKNIPYRSMRLTGEIYFQTIPALVGMPIVPVILTPENRVMQDSTPILQWFEQTFPTPQTITNNPILDFLNWLIEDFCDEYLPRISMHYRWGNDLCRSTVSHRIARRLNYGNIHADHAATAQFTLGRQSQFDRNLGINDSTRADLEAQFQDFLCVLEKHFHEHLFLLGNRPSIADFALYGPAFTHFMMDPTPAEIMERVAPFTCNWVESISSFGDPRGCHNEIELGPWISNTDIPSSLIELLKFIGTTYIPFSHATAKASHAREKLFSSTIRGIETTFTTHHYRAWSYEQVRLRYNELNADNKVKCESILRAANFPDYFFNDPILHNGLFDGLTPPFVENGIADNRIRHLKEKQKG